MVIYASEKGLEKLNKAKRWHADGTFKITPRPFKQTYIINARQQNGRMVPCAKILLQKKDTEIEKLPSNKI